MVLEKLNEPVNIAGLNLTIGTLGLLALGAFFIFRRPKLKSVTKSFG